VTHQDRLLEPGSLTYRQDVICVGANFIGSGHWLWVPAGPMAAQVDRCHGVLARKVIELRGEE
jgi:hypothetical protein